MNQAVRDDGVFTGVAQYLRIAVGLPGGFPIELDREQALEILALIQAAQRDRDAATAEHDAALKQLAASVPLHLYDAALRRWEAAEAERDAARAEAARLRLRVNGLVARNLLRLREVPTERDVARAEAARLRGRIDALRDAMRTARDEALAGADLPTYRRSARLEGVAHRLQQQLKLDAAEDARAALAAADPKGEQ